MPTQYPKSPLSTPILTDGSEIGALDDWLDSLRHARSRATLQTYRAGVRQYAKWAASNGIPRTVEAVARRHLQRWVNDLSEAGKQPASVGIYYRSAALFLDFCAREGHIDQSPAKRITRPTIKPPTKPVLTEDEIDALRAATRGRTFADRRNRALIALFLDTGLRRGEMAGLTVTDVELADDDSDFGGIVHVRTSKTKPRPAAFSAATATALRRYLAVRSKRKAARNTDALWLGLRGPLRGDEIRKVVARIGKRAGIDGLHPHLLRHTWTHYVLADPAMKEGEVMALGGWSTRTMLDRYGADRRTERAIAAARARFGRLAAA